MKKITYIASLFALISLTTGCEKQDVLRYDPNRAAIEFLGTGAGTVIPSRIFTFRDLPLGETEAVLSIPFAIVGFPSSVERHAVVSVVADSTTAESTQYEIISAIVPANAYRGTLSVRVINDRDTAFRDVHIRFRTERGKDFLEASQNAPGFNYYILRLTNNLPRPAEWSLNGEGPVNSRLGAYSSAFYAFVIQVTGETRFPFDRAIAGYNLDANGDPQPFSPSRIWVLLYTLDKALNEYNEERIEQGLGPFLHDDGHAAGHPVILGQAYRSLI